MSRTINNKWIIFTTTSLLLSGCASSYRRPESVDDKMRRYQAKTYSQNLTPALPKLDEQKHTAWFETKSGPSRAPASAVEAQEDQLSFGIDQSHKRLYFLTLYSQYDQLQKFSQSYQAPEMKVCPHFHSSLITHKESFQNYAPLSMKTRDYSADLLARIKTDESLLVLYPELALPMSTSNAMPRVIDVAQNSSSKVEQLIDKAISTHLAKAHGELSELCEFGSSDNYYIYENLMSSIEREGGLEKNSAGLHIVLKTSLMYNHALISALGTKQTRLMGQGRTPASAQQTQHAPVDAYSKELMRRMKVDWTQSYFMKIQQH